MTYQLSENVQKGILYLVKKDPEFFSQILPLVKAEFFDFPSYQRIYTCVVEYYLKYKNLPSDDALQEFIRFTTPEQVKDDNDYEDDLLAINNIDKSILENKEFVMDLVEDFAKKAAMKDAIKRSYLLVKEDKIGDIENIVRDALLVCRTIDVGQDYFEDVTARIHRFFSKSAEDRYRTVFKRFDKELEGGLCAKELAMVVAPPGVGKSLYLVNQGVKTLLEGKSVLYVSCEMSEDKIANRFDSVITLLKNTKLKESSTQVELRKRLDLVQDKVKGKLIIKEFATGTVSVNHVRALLTQLRIHKDFKPDLIIIDYLELLRPTREIESEYMAQQRIAEELRGLAVENKCLVWTATQTNRQARKVPIITDNELGDSYGKIRPADWVISLNQTEEEYDKGQMRIHVIKARDSKQRYTIGATINYSTLKMEDSNHEECEAEEE